MPDLGSPLEAAIGRPLSQPAKRLLLGGAAFASTLLGLAGTNIVRAMPALLLSLAVAAITFLAATWFGRPPRASRKALGFLIALETEGEELALQLRNDLVREIERLAEGIKLTRRFEIVSYSQLESARVTDENAARAALRASRCQLALYGRAKKRSSFGGKIQHVLEPRLLMEHRPIPQAASKALGAEMVDLVPARFLIDTQGDFLSFSIVSELVVITAQYTVAIVSAVLGDLAYAEELLDSVRRAASGRLRDLPPIRRLRKVIPRRIAAVLQAQAGREFRKWDQERDRSALTSLDQIANRILVLDPRNDFALMGRAIAAFVLRRDVPSAWSYVKRCSRQSGGTPLYSEAFLYLYEGNLERARAAYAVAARTFTLDPSDYLQSEVFLQEVLDQEPDKVQLLFGMGIINLLVKGDIEAAQRDFARFRAADTAVRYTQFHDWAAKQLDQNPGRIGR